MNDGVVIAGAGVTALSAADALRREGYTGRITMVGDESELPYQRPPLSKKFLRGEVARDAVQLRTRDFFDQNAIELMLGERVESIDLSGSTIVLAGGRRITYEHLLIATGAKVRRMCVPGSQLDGVHYLRTVADGERIRSALARRPRAVVVGTGFIGCEVAASLREVGCETALIGSKLPLEHVLGPEVGSRYGEYHRAHGVDVRSGVSVSEFRGSSRVEQAVLSDGKIIPCDLAIVGIGVVPALETIPPALQLENGVVTDEYGRTNVDRVWAAGDVADSWRPRFSRRVRFEHFMNAQLQGTAVGKNISGKLAPYDPVPYFWSDQFDLSLQYYGFSTDFDACVIRGTASQPGFVAFYLRGGRIEATCVVNQPRQITAAKRLLGKTRISPQLLADEGTDLNQLAAQSAPV